jgi:hypothetical protein
MPLGGPFAWFWIACLVSLKNIKIQTKIKQYILHPIKCRKACALTPILILKLHNSHQIKVFHSVGFFLISVALNVGLLKAFFCSRKRKCLFHLEKLASSDF